MKCMRTASCAIKLFLWQNQSSETLNSLAYDTIYIILCIIIWALLRRSTTSGVRNPKVSNTNGIKTCWLSEHTFSCFIILLDAASRDVYPKVKSLVSDSQVEKLKSNSHKHVCLYPSMNQNIHRSKCQSHILWVSQKIRMCLFF
jgi:hypothetical protein